MDYRLKPISKSSIAEAIRKVELYRNLNEPEEAESICRDILAVEPGHQLAQRLLGLAVTDQFTGDPSDRYAEAEGAFRGLADPYERLYYTGLLYERRAKAQLRAGRPAHILVPLFEQAMQCFADAEKVRPPENDDAILRWNRCVRLLQSLPGAEKEKEPAWLGTTDAPPR